MKDFIDKTSEKSGTPINRANMMAIQGFIAKTTSIQDNTIVEVNSDGHTLTTTYSNNQVKQVFVGEKTITKTTTFNEDGSIKEVIS